MNLAQDDLQSRAYRVDHGKPFRFRSNRRLTENNHFIRISEPIHQRAGGINELRGENIFEGTGGNTAAYGGDAFDPPYQYDDVLVAASEVRGLLEGPVGAAVPILEGWNK